MPTAKSSSSTARGGKARPRTSTNQASAASASSPKKRGGRKAVFQIISAGPRIEPARFAKVVGRRVLKLPKPTGRSKMHPLHRLALAVDKDINKANATYLLNDSINHDPYGDLHAEFERAKRDMTRLKLDFKRAPNFDVPLRDEDAQVDGNEGDLSGDVEDAGSAADPGLSAEEGAIVDEDSGEDAGEDTGVDAGEGRH
ncbi:hypothetical protein BN14_08975 [Rhizoctonia solani AG-1 IB]|uniref:Uncharacterized protein n=1 Tax=Thanatephorus cucumeris (strain AG1-IB / isolate 7/3/14) TaxID=1108050 RepID=M5C632_THACB|nr:hypothetical protein BN14_08975 [Rhizoctonia solani AG-1 IB]